MKEQRPLVGIAVIIKNKKGEILLGKRLTSLGFGEWQLTGGHLEFGESFEACAIRETKEETGLDIFDVQTAHVQSYVFDAEQKHYAVIYMTAKTEDIHPENLEPEKCNSWGWYSADQLPSPLYVPLKEAMDNGFDPFQ